MKVTWASLAEQISKMTDEQKQTDAVVYVPTFNRGFRMQGTGVADVEKMDEPILIEGGILGDGCPFVVIY